MAELKGQYGIVEGPDYSGDFKLTASENEWIYVDQEMLDFMIEHRHDNKGES
jgi:hypothetical protein